MKSIKLAFADEQITDIDDENFRDIPTVNFEKDTILSESNTFVYTNSAVKKELLISFLYNIGLLIILLIILHIWQPHSELSLGLAGVLIIGWGARMLGFIIGIFSFPKHLKLKSNKDSKIDKINLVNIFGKVNSTFDVNELENLKVICDKINFYIVMCKEQDSTNIKDSIIVYFENSNKDIVLNFFETNFNLTIKYYKIKELKISK